MFKKSLYAILTIIASIIVSGCATQLSEYNSSLPMSNKEGLIAVAVHNPNNTFAIQFESKATGETFLTDKFMTGSELRVMKLPEGDYLLKKYMINSRNYLAELSDGGFKTLTVKAGVLTYAGDIAFDAYNYNIVDNLRYHEATLTKDYPQIEIQSYLLH